MDALECKIASWFDGHGIFDRHHDSRTNQDLSGLGFVAKSRCDIGYRSDSGIVETSLKANGAERRESGALFLCQNQSHVPADAISHSERSDRRAHIKCHPHGLQGRILEQE